MPIRVGLAGFGTGGRLFHAPFLDADPAFSLDYVYERTKNEASAIYPYVKRVDTYEKLLEAPCDLIVIALPNVLHFSCVKAALEAGKHVLCDKPLCRSSTEALELFSLAKNKNLVLSVYQNRRFDAEIRTLRRLISQEVLGELKDVHLCMDRFQKGKNPKEWKNIPDQLTGIHYDLGIHLLDAAYSLFGLPAKVTCQLRTIHPWNTVPDRMSANLCYDNGLNVSISASQCALLASPCLIAHGSQGSYRKFSCDIQERLLNQGLSPRDSQWRIETEQEWGSLATTANQVQPYPSVKGDYGEYYRRFARTLSEGSALVDAREASEVLRILEAAILSSQSQRTVLL